MLFTGTSWCLGVVTWPTRPSLVRYLYCILYCSRVDRGVSVCLPGLHVRLLYVIWFVVRTLVRVVAELELLSYRVSELASC